jgi:hypothetical protein
LEDEMSKQANALRLLRIWVCAGSLALSLPLTLAGAAEAASSLSKQSPPQVSTPKASEMQRSMQEPANARQNEMQKLPKSAGGAQGAGRAQGNAMREAGGTAKSGGAASQMHRDMKSASQPGALQSQAKANQTGSTSKLSGVQQQLQNQQARQQQMMGGMGRAKSQ